MSNGRAAARTPPWTAGAPRGWQESVFVIDRLKAQADRRPAGSERRERQSTARRRRGKSKFVHHRLRAHAVDELSGVPGVYPGQQSNKRGYTMFTTPNRRRYRRPVRRPQGQSGSCVFGGGARTNVRPNRGIMPAHGGGARATPASTRGHMWGSARTRTQELIGANRS